MSETFNPFHEWLGLSAQVTAPNYYELLGLEESEPDTQKIATAADRAMSQVRSCKPGPQAAAWAQLLDQISAAKGCLTDPTQKQRYDEQLRAGGNAAPASISPATTALADPNMLPPGSTPAQVAPAALTQPAAPLAALDPMAPVANVPASAMAPLAQPAPAPTIPQATPVLAQAPTVPQALPVADPAPSQAVPAAPLIPQQPIAQPVQAVPFAGQPAIPVAAAVPVKQPVAMQAQPAAAPIAPTNHGVKRKVSATAMLRQRSGGGLVMPLIAGGGIGLVILMVVAVAMYLSRPSAEPPPGEVATGPPIVDDNEVAPAVYERYEPSRPNETPSVEVPAPSEPMETPFSPPVMEVPNTEPEPTPPAMMEEPKPTLEPEPTGPEMTREALRTLAQTLTTARDAVAEQNFTLAESELARAEPLAKLEEHKEKLRRLKLLADSLRAFRAAIDQTVSGFGAGDQVPYDENTSFGVVEASPEKLIIRVRGRNVTYTIESLPLGLARRLAEMSLGDSNPKTFALIAAFYSVSPKADADALAKAGEYWDQAAGAENLQDLITAVNDDYTLREDLAGLPSDPEPDAMVKLTERVERLKNSTRLEDFADEFKTAVEQSLENIQAGTEIAVGASTAVTVKEMKTDRIMVEFAGVTRGYRFENLPLGLASAIAEQTLPKDVPLTMIMKGAYFAAREKDSANKQFRETVLVWWQEAGEMDQDLQPIIEALVKQYPE